MKSVHVVRAQKMLGWPSDRKYSYLIVCNVKQDAER